MVKSICIIYLIYLLHPLQNIFAWQIFLFLQNDEMISPDS